MLAAPSRIGIPCVEKIAFARFHTLNIAVLVPPLPRPIHKRRLFWASHLELGDRSGVSIDIIENTIRRNCVSHWQQTSSVHSDVPTGYI